jgi:hypothetical protein
MAPSGRSARQLAVGLMNASLTSSRSRLQDTSIPSGRYVGTSCGNTAMSNRVICMGTFPLNSFGTVLHTCAGGRGGGGYVGTSAATR